MRFSLSGDGNPLPLGINGYAGNPPVHGFGRWYELEVTCRSAVSQATGYVIDIKTIDAAVRNGVIPAMEIACRDGKPPSAVLPECVRLLASTLPVALHGLRLNVTPYHSIEMAAQDTSSILIRQRFDFSAAHRLHSPALSDEENRKLYGKCNNPRGHGHNYVVEPSVRVPVGADFSLAELEAITDRVVISHFDHKHLNEDTTEFAVERGGVLPSVENIARICFDRLKPEMESHPARPSLVSITVRETDRTSATYPG